MKNSEKFFFHFGGARIISNIFNLAFKFHSFSRHARYSRWYDSHFAPLSLLPSKRTAPLGWSCEPRGITSFLWNNEIRPKFNVYWSPVHRCATAPLASHSAIAPSYFVPRFGAFPSRFFLSLFFTRSHIGTHNNARTRTKALFRKKFIAIRQESQIHCLATCSYSLPLPPRFHDIELPHCFV